MALHEAFEDGEEHVEADGCETDCGDLHAAVVVDAHTSHDCHERRDGLAVDLHVVQAAPCVRLERVEATERSAGV